MQINLNIFSSYSKMYACHQQWIWNQILAYFFNHINLLTSHLHSHLNILINIFISYTNQHDICNWIIS